jgi:uncharacterized membrane protein (Fun14 family)
MGLNMTTEILTNTLITGVGSFGAGCLVGYGLKKVIRLVVIVVGAIVGVCFIALALMQKQGYISAINWDKLSSDLYTSANSTLTNFHMDNIQHTVGYLGLPISSGLGLGLITGFLKG